MADPENIRKQLLPYFDTSMECWELTSDIAKKLNPIVADATTTYLSRSSYTHYMYGKSTAPEYLESLSSFLSRYYQDKVASSMLTATYGSSFGFMLTISHFFERGDFIFVEDITFPCCMQASIDYGLNIQSVNCDEDGINVRELGKKFQECKEKNGRKVSEKKPYWAIMYLMTVIHNPKGMVYSDERSKNIIQLARKYNVLVVTDDVYNFYQYDDGEGRCDTKRLVAYDNPTDDDYGNGHVISNGSLSKILFPSLRLGWIESSEWVIQQLNTTPDYFSGGSYNYFNQGLAAAILNHADFPSYFNDIRTFYAARMELTCDYLEKHLPAMVTFKRPKGGFVLWLELPKNHKFEALAERLKKYGIKLWPGENFGSIKSYANCFRMCVTNYPEKELLIALDVVCKEIKVMLDA